MMPVMTRAAARLANRQPVVPRHRGHVVITGASSGIGRALALQVAPDASSVLLIARRADQLDACADDMRRVSPGLAVQTWPADLADQDARRALAAELSTRDVDLLINNAGFGASVLFDEQDFTTVERMVDVNVLAVMQLTRAVLPGMIAARKGQVLVIGSGAGRWPLPKSVAYCATKHAVHGFCETLRLDLSGTGVQVTEVEPGPVATEFDAVAGMSSAMAKPVAFLRLSAPDCAHEALAGMDAGRDIVLPGSTYRVLMTLASALPRPLVRLAYRSLGSPRQAPSGR